MYVCTCVHAHIHIQYTYTVHLRILYVRKCIQCVLRMYIIRSTWCPSHLLLLLHRLQKDQSRSMDTEIESYKKAVLKEQEQNEQLTGMLRKLDADIAHVKKQIEASHAKREQLKVEYMTYTRALQETEEMLGKTTTVRRCTSSGRGGQ